MLLKRIALLIFLFTATMAQARLRPQPGEFGFEGEWIYFNPSFDYPFTLFAASFTNVTVGETNTRTTIGSVLANPFDYQSGFRVGAAYAFCECCIDFHIRYTWLLLQNSRFIKGYANMESLIGDINADLLGSAVAHQENIFDYHDVDSYLGKTLCCTPCLDLSLLGGIRYAQVELRYETTYGALNAFFLQKTDVFDKRTSDFWGVGPEIGLDFAYSLGCWLHFVGRAETGLLVSRVNGKKFVRRSMEFIGESREVTDIAIDPTCRLVPFYDLRFGVTFEQCCRWLSLSIEGGYEALSYLQALPIFADEFLDTFLQGYSNADLQGPYINVAIKF